MSTNLPGVFLLFFFFQISAGVMKDITSVHKPGEMHVIALTLHTLEPFTQRHSCCGGTCHVSATDLLRWAPRSRAQVVVVLTGLHSVRKGRYAEIR